MSLPNSDEVLQQNLDPVERTVVEELKTWLDANLHAEWKQSPRFRLVEQCSEIKLREILQQLAQVSTRRISKIVYVLTNAELQRRSFSVITLRLGAERRRTHSHISQSRLYYQIRRPIVSSSKWNKDVHIKESSGGDS